MSSSILFRRSQSQHCRRCSHLWHSRRSCTLPCTCHIFGCQSSDSNLGMGNDRHSCFQTSTCRLVLLRYPSLYRRYMCNCCPCRWHIEEHISCKREITSLYSTQLGKCPHIGQSGCLSRNLDYSRYILCLTSKIGS